MQPKPYRIASCSLLCRIFVYATVFLITTDDRLLWAQSLPVVANAIADDSDAELRPDVITVGFARQPTVPVYADSSESSDPIDTLSFADHVVVYGRRENQDFLQRRRFEFNGWIRVGDDAGPTGWTRSDDLFLTPYVTTVVMPGDSLFEIVDGQMTFLRAEDTTRPEPVSEHMILGEVHWLRLFQHGHNRHLWLKTEALRYDLFDGYDKFVMACIDGRVLYRRLNQGGSSGIDLPDAMQVIEQMEARFAQDDTVYVGRDLNKDPIKKEHPGVYLSFLKSDVLLRNERFDESIDVLEGVISQNEMTLYRRNPAGMTAARKLALIYERNMKDPAGIMRQYRYLVTRYPDEPVRGYESVDFADLEAAEQIAHFYEHNIDFTYDRQLMVEGADILLDESTVPAVRLLGYLTQIKILTRDRQYSEIPDILMTALREYPIVERAVDLGSFDDYSVKILRETLVLLRNAYQIDLHGSLSSDIQNAFGMHALSAHAALAHADLLHHTNAPNAEARAAYERSVQTYSEADFGWSGMPYRQWADTLVKELAAIGGRGRIITTTDMYAGNGEHFPVLRELTPGIEFQVLYPTELTPKDKYGLWRSKVQLDDGTIGWILRRNYTPE